MSFTNTTVQNNFIADGVTDTFAIPFSMLANNPDWIKVYQASNSTFAETLFTRGVQYDLSPDNVNPVNVVFKPAYIPAAANGRVIIAREIPITQAASFTNTGPFQKENYEKAIDKFMMIVAQINEKLSRTVPFAKNQLLSGSEIVGIPSAGKLMQWKDSLGNIESSELSAPDIISYAEAAEAAAAEAQQYGSGVTPFAFTNNMAATAVTGETGASTAVRARIYEVICVRGTLVAVYRFVVVWNSVSWQLIPLGFDGDDCGLSFTLTGTTTYALNLATTNATNGGNIYAFKRNVLV